MKFSSLQENLKVGLTIASHIAGKNVNLPILNNILVESREGKIKIATTNLEIGITTYVRGKVEDEGVFTVDSRMFSDFISLLPNKKIEIELQKNSLNIQCENYKTKIKGQDAEEYPLIPEVENENYYKIKLDDFKKALSRVVFAVSINEARLELSGVYFGFWKDKIILAATDSYRLAETEIKTEYSSERDDNEENIIVPAKTLQEVLRIISSVKENGEKNDMQIFISDNQILFKIGTTELISRLIEGQYPDYKQIIPANFKTEAVINKNELTRAIKASSLFSKTGVNDISLDFPQNKNQTIITSESGQSGESVVNLDSSVKGDDNGIIVNYRYLLDGLNNIDSENIRISVIDNNTPCVLKPEKDEKYSYVIMPIKQ